MKHLNEIYSRIKSYLNKLESEFRMPISKSVFSNNYFQSLSGFKLDYDDTKIQLKFTLPLTFRAAVAPQQLISDLGGLVRYKFDVAEGVFISYLSVDSLLNKAFVLAGRFGFLWLNSPYLSYVHRSRVWLNNYFLPSVRFKSFFSINNYITTWWKINQLTDLPEASVLYLVIAFIVDFCFKQN